MSNIRFVGVSYDEAYFIADIEEIGSLHDYIEKFEAENCGEYTENEILELSRNAYNKAIYENSLTAQEIVKALNSREKKIKKLESIINQLTSNNKKTGVGFRSESE